MRSAPDLPAEAREAASARTGLLIDGTAALLENVATRDVLRPRRRGSFAGRTISTSSEK